MVFETEATQVKDMLENNWSLAGDLLAASLHFDVGWWDHDIIEKPQITVSHLYSDGDISMFGRSEVDGDRKMLIHEILAVNIWIIIEQGAQTVADEREEDLGEIRKEVVRILNQQYNSYPPPICSVVPLDRGRYLHDLRATPPMLRCEILIRTGIAT